MEKLLKIKKIEYKPTSHFEKEWDLSRARISQLFKQNRIKGAIKPMRDILIPINAERPEKLKAGRKAIK